ncbi:hypothetical protein LS71_008220 [Helicobacter jaachi]|uniref:MobA/VirD2-like nuclease domain-containing protein n=1 Tax=Helicobacter jaachi TaxID=1677920 RepID=A0A4V6YS93_9HELI|nr:relaxase/mobilization nuclease domain-containing protein [Helicobacter jaachi]TLD95382.1 hypothetical protein LS71_008220 [Helicobacter jaachi]
MQEAIIDIPLEKYTDDTLFEYTKIHSQKVRQNHIHIRGKFCANFTHNIKISAPLYQAISPHQKRIVIKNIGSMKRGHLKNALAYVIRNGDLGYARNELDEQVALNDIFKEWEQDFDKNKDLNEAFHFVFSLNEIKSPQVMGMLEYAVRQTLLTHFGDYKWVIVPHTHQKQPHIHAIINKTNIFTKKKLHFKGKTIADMFNEMKEDFRHNLYTISRGKLNYIDEPFNKDIRENLIHKKMAALNNIGRKDSVNRNLSSYNLAKDMSFFNDTYKDMVASVNTRHTHLSAKQKSLGIEIKNQSIYLHNVSKKIKALLASGKTPTHLLAKEQDLKKALQNLRKNFQHNKQILSKLSQSLRHLLNWQDKFNHFTKDYTHLRKKQTLLNSLKGYEAYIPANLAKTFIALKNEVSASELLLNKHLPSFSQDIIALLSHSNLKENTFSISKNLYSIYKYQSILKSLNFEDKRDNVNKHKHLEDLDLLALEYGEKLKARFAVLKEHIHSLKEQLEAYYKLNKDLDIESISVDSHKIHELKSFIKLLRQYQYLDKEYALCAKSLIKHKLVPQKIKSAPPLSQEAIQHIQAMDSALKLEHNQSSKHKQDTESKSRQSPPFSFQVLSSRKDSKRF